MHLPPFMKKINELNQAIYSLNFPKVERMLADPEVPVNLSLLNVKLPSEVMITMRNPEMARLFLNCPRIDWLAAECKRSLLTFEQDYGIKLIRNSADPKMELNWLSYSFEMTCPEEAKLIYAKKFEAFIQTFGIENFISFMSNSSASLIASQVALNYAKYSDFRSKTGQTPLHTAYRLEIAKFYIEAGVDVNALDNYGCTPLMNAVKNSQFDVAALLIENGASKELISASLFSCVNGNNCKFILETFKFTEALFRDFLASKELISYRNLMSFFEEYPNFREIFFADLPGNLPSIYEKTENFDDIKEFRIDEWTDEDFLRFFKVLVTKTSYPFRHRVVSERLKRCATELLPISAISGLINDYRTLSADPNCIVDGKPLLFHVEPKIAMFLLQNGADPFFESDGFLFYERDDFFKIDTDTDKNVWNSMMQELLRKGFDLCSRNCKSGKSFVDYLLPLSTLKMWNNHNTIQMPVKMINNKFLKEHFSNEPDFLAILDDEGNTLAHYLVNVDPDVAFFRFTLSSELLEVKNKAGKSVLDCAVENSFLGAMAYCIEESELLKRFVEKCIALYGSEFIAKNGCRILSDRSKSRRITLSELKYFVEELKVPLEAIFENHNLPLDDSIFTEIRPLNHPGISDYLIEIGCRPSNAALHALIAGNQIEAVERLLDYCEDPNDLIYLISEDDFYFSTNEAFEAFLRHPRIRQAQPENCLNDCTSLDKYFFALSKSWEHVAQMLFQAGIDARKLIGSGLFCFVPNYFEFGFDDSVIDFLLRNGWTLEDFDNIFVREGYSLRQCFIDQGSTSLLQSRLLGENVLLSIFSDLKLDEVTGSKNECPICREEFVDAESVLLLSCKHVFHPECLSGYSRRNPDCPYCRSPLSSPLPK